MTTPTLNVENNLEQQLLSQYNGLTEEIKKYHDQQEADFQSQSNFVPEDRVDYLITNKVSGLDHQRQAIWNTLKDEFNKNTKEKHLNAKVMSQNKKRLCQLNAGLKEKQNELKELRNKNQTSMRHVEEHLYNNRSVEHQIWIYQVIFAILVLGTCVLGLAKFGVITSSSSTFVFGGILLVIFAFAIYQWYLREPNQDRRYWDKYVYQSPPTTTDDPNPRSNIDYDSLDKKLEGAFDKYTKTCPEGKKTPYKK